MLDLLDGVELAPTRQLPLVRIGPEKVFYPKDLGWLLRHAKLIRNIVILQKTATLFNFPGYSWEAYLVAHGERVCGRTAKRESISFEIEFASKLVLAEFLDRPSFRGLPINWFGVHMTIGDKRYAALPRP